MNIVLDFFNLLNKFFIKYLDFAILFLSLGLIFSFVFFLILSIKRKPISKLFFISLVVINLGVLAISSLAEKLTDKLPITYIFLSSVFYFTIKIVKIKTEVKKEETKLINLINEEYKKEIDKEKVEVEELKREKSFLFEEENPFLNEIKGKIKEQVVEDEICLDHAKNVIEKLKETTLSYYDKKAVKEIEYTLLTADGEMKGIVKSKINESLQQLLKIMAKYQL